MALITGAGTGIGQATAIRLGSLGWSVALGGRRQELLHDTAAQVIAVGGRAHAAALDVTDPGSVDAFFGEAEKELGPISAVINNAATARYGPLTDFDADEIDREVATKLLGSLYVARNAARRMTQLKGPRDIVFVTSSAAVAPWPNHLPYAAANAGSEQAARTLKLELEGTGVRVSIFRCGETAGTDFSTQEFGKQRTVDAFELWFRRGLLRHHGLMTPQIVADALTSMVSLPEGVQFELLHLVPVAPTAPLPATFEEFAGGYFPPPT